MISLLMFSGGIDSTYVLVKLLRETDDEVLVHHIHLVNNSGRHEPEKIAAGKIVAYCQSEYREFAYTQSAIDHRRFLAHGYDVISAGFTAGAVCGSYFLATSNSVERWFMGFAKDDQIPRGRVKRVQDCCEYNCQEGNAPELYLFQPVSLRAQVDYLPAALYEMTWSCRTPKPRDGGFDPCGECAPCKRRNAARRSAKRKPTKDELAVEALPWTRIVNHHGPRRPIFKVV